MTRLMNLETNEIIEVASYRTEKQQAAYIASKQAKASRDHLDTVRKRSISHFVFTEMGCFEGSLTLLNNKELGYFLLLQVYVDYKNMVKANADAKTPMTTKQIAEVLGVTEQTANRILKKLEKLSLIFRDKVVIAGRSYKAVFINSDYCFRKSKLGEFSDKKTDNTVKVFIESLQTAYEEGLQPAEIGFIYKTLQFIHYDTNLLVINPSEKDLDKVQTLSLDALATVVGLSVEETSRKVGNLQWNGMYVYGKIKVGRELMIKANPHLLYRKAGEFDKALGAEFIVNGKHNSIS
ncbi:helix-turn-helix domain-containing protein [Terribacillus halophilus]|uniref:helix-turn-helix domain-containing protein n=1 Tax=Terribacillus halophilus TaxID=361279 RepID=UPI00098411C8|nr:helix-turn-helix domain-containing protein [Terribacillus halophilus]